MTNWNLQSSQTYAPGNYTAIVRGVNNMTGVGLVEVYDLSGGASSILGNISTRAFVQTDDNVMIGGFIVHGTASKRVIVRAIGPELTHYGISNALSNPTLGAARQHWSTDCLVMITGTIQSSAGLSPAIKWPLSGTAAMLRETEGSRRSSQTCQQVTTPRSCAV